MRTRNIEQYINWDEEEINWLDQHCPNRWKLKSKINITAWPVAALFECEEDVVLYRLRFGNTKRPSWPGTTNFKVLKPRG